MPPPPLRANGVRTEFDQRLTELQRAPSTVTRTYGILAVSCAAIPVRTIGC